MRQICLQSEGFDAAPRTTEESIYPNIDDTYSVVNYTGPRLVVRTKQQFGIKQIASIQSSLQGMAIYGDTMVRMANGLTHYIYKIMPSGVLSQLATFSIDTGHSNSLQFAPSLESGQDLPYLYVAKLENTCIVLSITSAYVVSVAQTITVDSSIDSGNIQIGDDGHIWSASLDSGDHYHFVKFRRVSVSEGDVILTSSDIVDEWATVESYPYSIYVWQGMKIHEGKIWFVHGQTGSKARGIVIYDTITHAYVTRLDLSVNDVEYEDMDFWNNSVLVGTYGTQLYQLKF